MKLSIATGARTTPIIQISPVAKPPLLGKTKLSDVITSDPKSQALKAEDCTRCDQAFTKTQSMGRESWVNNKKDVLVNPLRM